MTGPLVAERLRGAVDTVVARHPNLVARFHDHFDQPVQIIPGQPETPWRYVELDGDADVEGPLQRVCAAERAAVCDLTDGAGYVVKARAGRSARRCRRSMERPLTLAIHG